MIEIRKFCGLWRVLTYHDRGRKKLVMLDAFKAHGHLSTSKAAQRIDPRQRLKKALEGSERTMTMHVAVEELLGLDEPLPPTDDTVLFKLMLDFEVNVYMRLKELGLKQKGLAKLLDVLSAAVSKMLSPTGNLSLRTMAKVAAVLGCEFVSLKIIGTSDTTYTPLSDLEVLTTLMTEDDPFGLMIDEDLGVVFWSTDISCSESLDDETESIEYARGNGISIAYGKTRSIIENITAESPVGKQTIPPIDPFALLRNE